MAIDELVTSWRAEAARLRGRYGAESLAQLCEAHAAELEDAIKHTLEEELSVDAAAAESGYSASQIRRLFPDGRIRRRDLPRKPKRRKAGALSLLPSEPVTSEAVKERLRSRYAGGATR